MVQDLTLYLGYCSLQLISVLSPFVAGLFNIIMEEQPRQTTQHPTRIHKLSSSRQGQKCYSQVQGQRQDQHSNKPRAQIPYHHQTQSFLKPMQDVEQTKKHIQPVQTQTSQWHNKIDKDPQQLMHTEILKDNLKTESNKIIKWQVKKDTECRELRRKLSESQKVIEGQSNTICDLQMNCQHILLQGYQEELKGREELEERVDHARQVSTILQEHFEQLEVTLKSFTTNKDILKSHYNVISEHIDKLTERFDVVCNEYKAQNEHLRTLVSNGHEEKVNYINKANKVQEMLEQKLLAEQKNSVTLKQELLSSNSHIRELSDSDSSNTLEFLEKYATLMQNMKTVNTQKETLMKEVSDLKYIRTDFVTLEEAYNKLSNEKKKLEDKLETMLKKIVHLETSSKECLVMVENSDTQKNSMANEIIQLRETYQNVNNKLSEEMTLSQKLHELLVECESSSHTKSEELLTLQAKYESDTTKMKCLWELEKNAMAVVESELKQSVSNFKEQLKGSSEKIMEHENQIQKLKNATVTSERKIEKLTLTVRELTTEKLQLQQLFSKIKDGLNNSTYELSKMKMEKNDLLQNAKELEEEVLNTKSEIIQIKSQLLAEKVTAIEKCNNQLNEVMNEKKSLEKNVRDLEELVSIIKEERNIQLKEATTKIMIHQNKIVMLENQMKMYSAQDPLKDNEDIKPLSSYQEKMSPELKGHIKGILKSPDQAPHCPTIIKHVSFEYNVETSDGTVLDISTAEVRMQHLKRAYEPEHTQSQPDLPLTAKKSFEFTSSQDIWEFETGRLKHQTGSSNKRRRFLKDF